MHLARMTPMSPAARIILLVPFLYACWLGMELVHESGHVLLARLGGGRGVHVELPLLGFSRTDVAVNPHPALTAWGGPALGALGPVLIWTLVAAPRFRSRNLRRLRAVRRCLRQCLQFFAGFCLIANGVYLGVGWVDRTGDAGDLLRYGTSVGWLVVFGVAACGTGLYLWHRFGSDGKNSLSPGVKRAR